MAIRISKLEKQKRKSGKLSDAAEIFGDKTKSPIPKTPFEKKAWIQARRFVAASTGKTAEADIPWEDVTTIYKDQLKNHKLMHDKDIQNAKIQKSLKKMPTRDSIKKRSKSLMK